MFYSTKMKKIKIKKMLLMKRRNIRKLRQEKRYANFLKNSRKIASVEIEIAKKIKLLRVQRNHFMKAFYRKHYKGHQIVIPIEGEFGLEKQGIVDYFFYIANNVIDFESRELIFDFSKCTRLWPSAVTLLCSLMQWVELSSRNNNRPPKLGSIPSEHSTVNSYLYHCGFYDYVKLGKKEDSSCYDDKDVVKIQREKDRRNIEQREDGIVSLLEENTNFTKDEIELFANVILIEVFNNVVEHGVGYHDNGWWILAQYHKRHGIISLSVADNGIGIRNTLMTGPQQVEIAKKLTNSPKYDGDFIKYALQENVSGAITASIKDMGFLLKKFSEGARRGNGLKRIMAACNELKVRLVLMSQNGFVQVEDGELHCQSFPNRVFAGTLYHFTIPAKRSEI